MSLTRVAVGRLRSRHGGSTRPVLSPASASSSNEATAHEKARVITMNLPGPRDFFSTRAEMNCTGIPR